MLTLDIKCSLRLYTANLVGRLDAICCRVMWFGRVYDELGNVAHVAHLVFGTLAYFPWVSVPVDLSWWTSGWNHALQDGFLRTDNCLIIKGLHDFWFCTDWNTLEHIQWKNQLRVRGGRIHYNITNIERLCTAASLYIDSDCTEYWKLKFNYII